MKQWQQDISNVVDKNSLDIKNLKDNSEVGKLTARIDNIEAKDREQDVQLSNHGEQLENLFNKINTDVANTKTEINNTIEQLRLNTNNSITALQTSTDRALDTIKQNTADSITALQTSIDRHTKELDNCVRSVNGVNADANGNIDIIVPDATTEVKGKVQLCDDIEQNTTNRTMAVTPHAVAAYVSAGGNKANDIGIVGRQGFGVSFPDATEDELATIGMTPMNGTYDKTSDNYGNFMSDNGGVFVYIPHYYVRYGEQTEADYDVYGANVLGVKSHDAYNSETEANADGYFSPRAFYDGSESVNQQGFFMQKYEPWARTIDGVIYPYGDGSARGMVNIIPPDMMTRARNLGSDYFVASYFMHQAMDTITLLQGQHSTGTANCAWWKFRGGANYPNSGWSTTNPQLYSHNGQKNGVMGVSNFTWEFCLGVTTSGTSATQGQTKVANNKIYLLKPTVKIKDLTNGFGGPTDAWGTDVNLLENYDEFDTTDHFVLTSSRTWYWGNGNNQMYISPIKNGVLDAKARDSFMLIPNSEQSVSSSANTMMGACLSYTSPCTQNLALYIHGENINTSGGQNVFSRNFLAWRVASYDDHSFRCGAYLRD